MIRIVLLLAMIGLALVSESLIGRSVSTAATINAATCSRADVQAALDTSESNGDTSNTIEIPAGTCGWATTVSKIVTKDLIMHGAGEASTIIQDDTSGVILLSVTTATGKSARFTNWTFEGGTNITDNSSSGTFGIAGTSTLVRVDHMTFRNMAFQIRYLLFVDCAYGLVDHVTMQQARGISNGVAAYHRTCGGQDFGHYNFSIATPWNSAQCVFVEDSSFDEQVAARTLVLSAANDIGFGGCMVVRYNTISNLFVQNHGVDAFVRGGRHLEAYGNTFQFLHGYTSSNQAIWFESGTGVAYSNTVPSGWTVATRLLYDRSSISEGSWGICNGSSVYDANSGSPAGYFCADQPGRGQGILYTGISPPLPASSASQSLEPVYVWNNGGIVSETTSQSAHVVINRDYFESAKPSYTAYTYPHPLQGVSSSNRRFSPHLNHRRSQVAPASEEANPYLHYVQRRFSRSLDLRREQTVVLDELGQPILNESDNGSQTDWIVQE